MAGVAALLGHDPLRFLGLSPDDAQIAAAALNEAARLYAEREQGFLDYLAAKTANHTTTGFAQVMRGFIKALRASGRG